MVKNVIIVNDFDYIQGGASKVAIQTAEMLSKYNINVVFFSAVSKNKNKHNDIKYISTNQNEALKEKNKLKGIINGIYNFKAKKEFKKLLNNYSNEDTVIHVHGWTKALSSSIFSVAFKKKFKVYLTLHDYFTACPNGGYFNYKKNKICDLKQMSCKCLCTNCDSRNYLFKIYRVIRQFVQNNMVGLNKKIKYCIGISDLNIEVLKSSLNSNVVIKKIINPIDFKFDKKVSNINDNKYYTYIGRITKEKGVNNMCNELGKYNTILIVGDGSEKEILSNQYPNMNFIGWKNSIEINECLKNTRILILPSLWYEGAPLVPLEAMSIGIPCIISNCCSAREYINNNNGIVYDPYKRGDLKNKIKLVENRLKYFSNGAYEYAKQIKDNDYINQLIEFYNYKDVK